MDLEIPMKWNPLVVWPVIQHVMLMDLTYWTLGCVSDSLTNYTNYQSIIISFKSGVLIMQQNKITALQFLNNTATPEIVEQVEDNTAHISFFFFIWILFTCFHR